MLLEMPNRAPIPALDVCACCMASGAAADLKKVRCGAGAPADEGSGTTVHGQFRRGIDLCDCRYRHHEPIRGGAEL
jgi:hypothetical protein